MTLKTRTHVVRTALLLTFALTFITGCHKNTSGVNPASLGPSASTDSGPAAPTATLTAEPLAIDLGQSVVLNWRTTNATSVTIDGIGTLAPNGTQTVSPSSSTNFHLTAKGDGGTVEANARVTVRVPTAPEAMGDTTTGGSGNIADDIFHQNVQDVFFDYDSYDLRPDAQASTSKAAGFLVAHPDVKIVIGGYCDDRGSAEYNLALGENRANSAKTALVNAGVAASRIRVVSYGKEKQFCTEENETCWQENRRAQFTVDR
jgi:peptidoglycan-associated lipoprotein